MAKRYASSLINEVPGAHCLLPDQVINKEISKNKGFSQSEVKDLYSFVENQFANDRSDIQRIQKAEKF